MKKHFLSFALVATMVGSIIAGCSTKTDSAATVAPAPTTDTTKTDTAKTDTTKKDTTKKPM